MNGLTPTQQTWPAALAAGVNVFPPREDSTKAPWGDWKAYQSKRVTPEQCRAWWGPRTGIGAICGRISGNLELFEFDDRDTYHAFKELAQQAELGDLVARLEAGYCEDTPSGGVHWLYRCSAVTGNLKLATRPKRTDERDPANRDDDTKVLIETRGEGGYVVLAPSNGKVHPTGRPYVLRSGGFASIPILTPDERADLHNLARAFHEAPPKVQPAPPGPPRPAPSGDLRPGDDYTARTTWRELLEAHGWTAIGEQGEHTLWRRPGKRFGISATTNHAGSDLLWVFSTSTRLEAGRSYDRFGAYAVLEHGGDQRAAARALAAKGYGTPARTPVNGHTRLDAPHGQTTQGARQNGATAPPEDKQEPRPAFVLLDDVEVLNRPAPPYLVDGRIVAGSFGATWGESGGYKTFLMLDCACSVASGRDWLGARIVRPGPVVYVVGEGAGGIGARLAAWKTARGFPLNERIGFFLVPSPVYLMFRDNVTDFLAALAGATPALIVFDTMARCMAGGDENSAADIGTMVNHCDLIRERTGAAVWLVHHSTKNGGSERGSSALRGACDTMFSMSKADDLVTLACDKQKDAEPFESIPLHLTPVEGTSSCVLRPASQVIACGDLTANQRRLLDVLRSTFGQDGATTLEWQKASPDVNERSFYRAKKVLIDRGIVTPGPRFSWTGRTV